MENKINKSFLKIQNKFFEKNKDTNTTIFHNIETNGFAIYCYILMRVGNQPSTEINIKKIITFFNYIDTVKDDKKAKKKVNKSKAGLKDARSVKKYIARLIRTNLIEIIGVDFSDDKLLEEIEKIDDPKIKSKKMQEYLKKKNKAIDNYLDGINVNYEMEIKVNDYVDSDKECFSRISSQLFTDYIKKIGHIGFSVYCLLFKLHNAEFGGDTTFGFANPSREYIADILNISVRTVSEYIGLFENLRPKLIEIEEQPIVETYNSILNKDEKKQEPHHYIIYQKVDSSNKYYIG